MLDDGVKGVGAGEEVTVTDIAMTVLEAIHNGERRVVLPAVAGADDTADAT
jgi:hypothetical protein